LAKTGSPKTRSLLGRSPRLTALPNRAGGDEVRHGHIRARTDIK
jgi:hypothetical protein